MDDWQYCKTILPRVSRTFALNIAVLRGDLHRSILTAYLFCRIIDTVEDAARLDAKVKIRLLLEFAGLMVNPEHRARALDSWLDACREVDGSPNDLDLLSQTGRVFNVFDSLKPNHQQQIIPSVTEMARGMAYFQKKFCDHELTLLEDENELEEYCFYVAGAVGEMLCNLFLEEMPGLPAHARETMRRTAVSFGLGLQMTNISKDIIVDRGRGWSYIPKSYITDMGLAVEDFNSGADPGRDLVVLERLLRKTLGHLKDALKFTLAIPPSQFRLRLFCIWPLWMALETVAVLHNNRSLLTSDDPVKISRETVRRILRRTRILCRSDLLLRLSFYRIERRAALDNPPVFQLDALKRRLAEIRLEPEITSPA